MKQPDLEILPDQEFPWFVQLKFRFDMKLKDFVKEKPGARWTPATKTWRLPIELLPDVTKYAQSLGYRVGQP